MKGKLTNDQNHDHSDDEQPELHEDASSRFNQIDNVLVISNLNYLTTGQEIEAHFHGYHVKFIQILANEIGQSRGFALVELENSDKAKAAINELDKTQLHNRQIRVQKAAAKDIYLYHTLEMKHRFYDINYQFEYQKYNLFASPLNSTIEKLTKIVANNATQIKDLSTKVDNNATQIKDLGTKIDNNATQIKDLSTKIDNNATQIKDLSTKIDNNATQIKNLSTKIDKVIVHIDEFADVVQKNQNNLNHPIKMAEIPHFKKDEKNPNNN